MTDQRAGGVGAAHEWMLAQDAADYLTDTYRAACSCGWGSEPWNDQEEAGWAWQTHAENAFLSDLNDGAVLHEDGTVSDV